MNFSLNGMQVNSCSAAPPEQAQNSNESGGPGGIFAALPEVVSREAKILQKQAQKQAKMQRWLASGDPILEAEARQWLTASSLAPPNPHRDPHT